MKLFSILAFSAGATSFTDIFEDLSTARSEVTYDSNKRYDGSLALLKTRYRDMPILRVYDNSEYFLRKKTKKLYRELRRRKGRMERKGCWVSGSQHPFNVVLTEKMKCNIFNTLMIDIVITGWFFLGSDPKNVLPPQCDPIADYLNAKYYLPYTTYFAGKKLPVWDAEAEECCIPTTGEQCGKL